MITLAQINDSLHAQTEIANRTLMTARSTDNRVEDLHTEAKSVHKLIEEMVENQRQQALDAVENRRENPQFYLPPPPGAPARPGSAPGGVPVPAAPSLSGTENLVNNILGGMVGGGLAAKVIPKLKGVMKGGLKIGAVAILSEMLLNAMPDSPDKEEITGDIHRTVAGLGLGSLFGKSFVGALAGYITDDMLSVIKKSDYAMQLADWLDQYTSKIGVEGDTALAVAAAGTASLVAVESTKAAVKVVTPAIVEGAKTALTTTANAAVTKAPAAGTAIANGAKSLYNSAKAGASSLFTAANAPLIAFTATLGGLTAASLSYRDMLEKYPEMAPMNNGAGPGLQVGNYLIEHNMIDEAIADQKKRGLYKEKYVAPDMSKVLKRPDMSGMILPPAGGTSSMPERSKEIESYLGITPLEESKAPTLVPPSNTTFSADWIAGGKEKAAPTVIVVPATPAPASAPSGGGKSSTAIFTSPVSTTDRLDGMDRITRPR